MTAWNRERPTKTGFYWSRFVNIAPDEEIAAEVVEVFRKGGLLKAAFYDGNSMPIENILGTEWYGPLEVPK